ncbi:hypothetical protein CEXT_4721 [Caerostris extrusa]|uniref:Uncharacterized protein n=1 Tax=Caerostris extrusa TaxID=172846 RepID=A0AAV4PKC2_CAEEX|nr:hypothetical protein CEXT_4721 [Caerostris extrusa]
MHFPGKHFNQYEDVKNGFMPLPHQKMCGVFSKPYPQLFIRKLLEKRGNSMTSDGVYFEDTINLPFSISKNVFIRNKLRIINRHACSIQV